MSSDDDEAVLRKHSERLITSLARPLTKSKPGETGMRRQSRDSKGQLSQEKAGERQSQHSKPARKAGLAALSEDDSENDANLMSKHTNKLLQSQVVFDCLLADRISVSNLIAFIPAGCNQASEI